MVDRRFLHEHLADSRLPQVLDAKIAICGCGAIGSNLAESLARRGFKNLWLVDRDRIELHNISTQVWFEQDVGRFKAEVLAVRLYYISKANAVPIIKNIRDQKMLKKLLPPDINLVVDSFDNRAARSTTIGLCPNVLHVGLSAYDTSEVAWDENYTLPPDVELEDPCNYPLSRTLIEFTVASAASAILKFLLNGVKVNREVTGV